VAGAATSITDGGMETVLVFHRGIDLPHFASFPLLDTDEGTQALREYFEPFFGIAREHGVGLVLDTPTWRANPDWGELLGYDAAGLAEINRKGVRLLEALRAEHPDVELTICGCIGPRGDGYRPTQVMTAGEAQRYHAAQVDTFAATEAGSISVRPVSVYRPMMTSAIDVTTGRRRPIGPRTLRVPTPTAASAGSVPVQKTIIVIAPVIG
jgi:homocysteine S-methyltransferase